MTLIWKWCKSTICQLTYRIQSSQDPAPQSQSWRECFCCTLRKPPPLHGQFWLMSPRTSVHFLGQTFKEWGWNFVLKPITRPTNINQANNGIFEMCEFLRTLPAGLKKSDFTLLLEISLVAHHQNHDGRTCECSCICQPVGQAVEWFPKQLFVSHQIITGMFQETVTITYFQTWRQCHTLTMPLLPLCNNFSSHCETSPAKKF